MSEQTLVLIKPDGVRRGLIGEILGRFERRGLRIRGLKMLRFDVALAERHYAEHVEKPFFPALRDFITSGPVVAVLVEGPEAIQLVRSMMGQTKPSESASGTIRGDLATTTTENVIHGSDSPERARIEREIFFTDSELF
ncbi:nucleoside-diphosphate kinase [Candidatus Sumerlaeota bacterium]|nr:nucleoside-diphosphate kinase [Candidatus Sumerlaeota bacterium]